MFLAASPGTDVEPMWSTDASTPRSASTRATRAPVRAAVGAQAGDQGRTAGAMSGGSRWARRRLSKPSARARKTLRSSSVVISASKSSCTLSREGSVPSAMAKCDRAEAADVLSASSPGAARTETPGRAACRACR